MKILIISGAGILAGTHIYNQLIRELVNLRQMKSDRDFPEVVLYNYPFKSIKNNGELDENLAQKELEPILRQFSHFDHVVIACNTLHLLNLKVKNLLSLPENALKEYEQVADANKKALVLCSEHSRKNSLFGNNNVFYPDEEINDVMDRIINDNICSYKTYKRRDFKGLNKLIEEGKFTHLIIGCTELSIIEWQKMVNVQIIDSSSIIIKNVVKEIEKTFHENL